MSIGAPGMFGGGQYLLVHTTRNPEKVGVGDDVTGRFFGLDRKTVVVKPPIDRLLTPTQPVGGDIKYGAISRIDVVKEMMDEQNPLQDSPVQKVMPKIYVSFENGLRVKPDAEKTPLFDVACVCIEVNNKRYIGESVEVPVRVNNEHISLMTDQIREELGPDADIYDFQSEYHTLSAEQKAAFNLMIFGHRDGCDENDAVLEPQVKGLRQRVIETLQDKGVRDYWLEYSDGSLTRQKGLTQALKSAVDKFINDQSGDDKLRLAQTMKQSLISRGLPASLGDRYGQTVWMRDFGIMTQTLDEVDVAPPEAFKQLTDSLATIARKQFSYGLIPQVVIPDPLLGEFVYHRALGGDSGLGWYHQLRDFMAENYPKIAMPTLDSESLKTIAPEELKTKLNQLYSCYQMACEQANVDGLKVPKPSHTLKGLLADTLGTLTPGTTDSEIHFIRSMAKLLDLAGSQEQKDRVRELVPNLAHAMAYLDKSVLDPANGLPQGGDNRDMLDPYMFEKLLCSNACFLYQGFTGLARHLDEIGPQLKTELSKYYPSGTTPASGFIAALLDDNPQARASVALEQFGQLIKKTFIYSEDGKFAPRDFIDSDHLTGRKPTTTPENYITPLINANKDFLEGKEVNLQGLALAIENGLVNPEDHPAAVKLIRSQLTDAGLKVFSPINMANPHEVALLQNSKGFLVWPQIEYRVIDALANHMTRTPEVEELLTKLHEAGDRRKGLSEWYNLDLNGQVYAGGANGQAWSIMLMDKALRPANRTDAEQAMEIDESA
ncbi:hypothetical protein [Endozoicomonas sp. YOMI1]|uniref:hypothetical protein n=1 Tax=Endozoicomonas sp. YOMI1 TaxID=2828739 RepID=UPI0021485B1A|nr:hypothetical protein [Endozoicomonas sp. YOMI1]